MADEFGHGLDFEFGFDVGAVDFDGLEADVDLVGHFLCALPLGNQSEDFKFTVSQMSD